MPQSESGRDSGGRKRSSERQSTKNHLSAAAQGRCNPCGRLLVIFTKGGLEVKCKRCKGIQFFPWLELDRRRRELR